LILLAILVVLVLARMAAGATREGMRELGAEVYDTYCVGCHGPDGDGAGPAARMLLVKPRDFTKGLYKFRSTPNGTLPTDEDLLRIVTNGVNRTAMPPFHLVPEVERRAVVEYVKGFYPQWEEQGAGEPIFLPAAPDGLGSPESVARGRQLYEMLDCGQCHGASGRGDGPSSKTMAPDSWGNPQKPFDFTRGALKSGGAPVDVYRTFMTGLNGTAMPSYADVFAAPDGESIREGDAWNLVAYIISLRGESNPAQENAAEKEQAP
jgi:cytochrome c oxidase cbb3-type subunit 2